MTRRVLIVEDDEKIRRVIRLILASDRLAIDEAPGGREALEMLARNRYDLMILDLMMPEVGGLEVLQQVRAGPETRDLPVIIVTAKTSDADFLEGFRKGANYYLAKPFEPRELVDSVELILGLPLEGGGKAEPARPPPAEGRSDGESPPRGRSAS